MKFPTSNKKNPLNVGEIQTIAIHDLARGGSGVGKSDVGSIVFVPYTTAGDTVSVEIDSVSKNYSTGRLIQVMNASPDRIDPPCKVFGICGGCDWQHVSYDIQWRKKVEGLKETLTRSGFFSADSPALPIQEIPSEDHWNYRNRIQMRARVGESGPEIGFYKHRSQELVPIERCEIAREEINRALPDIRQAAAREFELEGREVKVEIELSKNGEIQTSFNQPHGAFGFRQINDGQNIKLQELVARFIPDQFSVWDLFGGAGNLTLKAADRVKEVLCVDLGARKDPQEVYPTHFRHYQSDVLKWLEKGPPKPRAELVCILDPPRVGLGKEGDRFVHALGLYPPNRIIHVGCDPDSFAKDLIRIQAAGYRCTDIFALDLFPQTHHVESIAVFEKA